jgi:hypothetical protein
MLLILRLLLLVSHFLLSQGSIFFAVAIESFPFGSIHTLTSPQSFHVPNSNSCKRLRIEIRSLPVRGLWQLQSVNAKSPILFSYSWWRLSAFDDYWLLFQLQFRYWSRLYAQGCGYGNTRAPGHWTEAQRGCGKRLLSIAPCVVLNGYILLSYCAWELDIAHTCFHAHIITLAQNDQWTSSRCLSIILPAQVNSADRKMLQQFGPRRLCGRTPTLETFGLFQRL